MGSNRLAVACLVLGALHSAAFAAESSPEHALVLPFAQAGSSADVSELQRAQALLTQGQAAQAYELLSAREADWAGIPLYDYLLGMAALDSGRSGEAIFSLQRVVVNEPAFSGARMELARAHYEAGELKASRTQFQYLLTQSPPPATRSIIERYLAAIDGRGTGGGVRPFVELGAGFDSNANGSTSEQTFLGFTLDEQNVETDSPFFELAAGLNQGVAIGEGGSWSNGLRLSHRFNPDADFIDQSIGSLGSVLGWSGQRGRASAGVSGYYSLLDGEDHEWGAALDLATGRRFGDNWDVGVNLRGGPVRYEAEQLLILETNRYLGALTLTRLNIGGRAARMGLALLGGRDDERQENSPYGNERRGARLTAGWTISPRAGMYLEAGFLRTEYDDTPGFFGVDREDEETSGLIATEFQGWPGRGWTLSPRLRYVQHDSNVTLYEYDRWEASVYLRRSYR